MKPGPARNRIFITCYQVEPGSGIPAALSLGQLAAAPLNAHKQSLSRGRYRQAANLYVHLSFLLWFSRFSFAFAVAIG
jgi:hypothetical protein